MSEDVNVDVNLAPIIRVASLPESARLAFVVSRSLAAFWRMEGQKYRHLDSAVQELQKQFSEAMKGVEDSGVSIPNSWRDTEEWSTLEAFREKSLILWRLGQAVLRIMEVRMEWHPETFNLEVPPTADAALAVRIG